MSLSRQWRQVAIGSCSAPSKVTIFCKLRLRLSPIVHARIVTLYQFTEGPLALE